MFQQSYQLKPHPPFRLDLAAWTLRRQPSNAIDDWDGTTYRRVLSLSGEPTLIEVRQIKDGLTPRLSVVIRAREESPSVRSRATAAVECLLGIRRKMEPFYEFASTDATLRPLATRFVGMKPPRYLTLFECLSNAIACQQVSLASGLQLLNRFASRYGRQFVTDDYRQSGFPVPEDLLDVEIQDLRELGFSRQKAAALLGVAKQCREDVISYDSLRSLADQVAVDRLCELRGIGRWSAEYALLRGLGRLDVFPGDDVGARNLLGRWLDLATKLEYAGVADLLDRWAPYRGLIYFHLLLQKLESKQMVIATPREAESTPDTERFLHVNAPYLTDCGFTERE